MTTRRASHVLTGTRIRERRMSLARRQSDIAREAGISPAYLNLIEHNRRPVSPDLVARLAEVLAVPVDELNEGREGARIAALREAAARLPQGAAWPAPEDDRLPEFIARYPGWAAVLAATGRRADGLERQLVNLSDRMTQDPYLLATLHEILSAVTSVRSTASILAEEGDLPDEWLRRFHGNLNDDSLRLSGTAQALVAYLDSFETDSAIFTPQEEVESWMAAGAPALDAAPELASDAARQMAAAHLARMADDRALLPDAALASVAAADADPLAMAAQLRRPLDLVMRRLVALRPAGFEGIGLLICDASGSLILRDPAPGFSLPRPGDTCPLWPLYEALAMPQTAIARLVEPPDGRRFRTISYATRSQPGGMAGPVLTRAHMLILPATPTDAAQPAIPIGTACRICPRADCAARREPSILGVR